MRNFNTPEEKELVLSSCEGLKQVFTLPESVAKIFIAVADGWEHAIVTDESGEVHRSDPFDIEACATYYEGGYELPINEVVDFSIDPSDPLDKLSKYGQRGSVDDVADFMNKGGFV